MMVIRQSRRSIKMTASKKIILIVKPSPQPSPRQSPEHIAPTQHGASQPSSAAQILSQTAATLSASASPRPAGTYRAGRHKEYVIFLSSHYSEAEAAGEQAHIAKLGVHSDIYPVTLNHRKWYRLRSGSFASKAEAQTEMEKLKARTGLNGAWLEMGK